MNIRGRVLKVLNSGVCNTEERIILEGFIEEVEYEDYYSVKEFEGVELFFSGDEEYIDNIIEVLEVVEELEEVILSKKYRGVL